MRRNDWAMIQAGLGIVHRRCWEVLRSLGLVWEEGRKGFPELMLEQHGAGKSVC